MLTAMSGQPLLITQSSSLQVTRPDYVGGPAILSGSRDTLQYLNRAAFALVPISPVSGASIRPGNVGNGAVRGPGLQNLDLSLAKNVAITERLKLQLRGGLVRFPESHELHRALDILEQPHVRALHEHARRALDAVERAVEFLVRLASVGNSMVQPMKHF